MKFEEWWDSLWIPNEEQKHMANVAWEAGIEEGVLRMYRLYDICPECNSFNGQHKSDCGRGHESN